MPHIQLETVNGQRYTLDTLDVDKIGPWLQEWIPRLGSPNMSLIGMCPRLVLSPLWDPVTDKPDLPNFGVSHHLLNAAGAEQLCETIRKLARSISP